MRSTPLIFIDGAPTPPSAWGRTVLPVRPGRHHVHVVASTYGLHLVRRMGPADAIVEVLPGQVTELEYKAPIWETSPGSLGIGPQGYNGGKILIGGAVALVAFIFVIGGVITLAALL